jgi:peptidoglycan/LPS O-acetylase OafA/YrhL
MMLALTVALGHGGGIRGYFGMNGTLSVQVFYMISGFLIALILATKYDTKTTEGLQLFYTNRALRIYIPYWTVLFGTLAVAAVCYSLTGIITTAPTVQYLQRYGPELSPLAWLWIVATNVGIVGQEAAFWLTYNGGSPEFVWNGDTSVPLMSVFQIIPQAWSLSLELMFYALAPWLLARRPVLVAAVLAIGCYAARIYGARHGLTGSGFQYRFFPFELGLFMAGTLAYRLYALLAQRSFMRFWPSVGVTIATVGAVVCWQYSSFLNSNNLRLFVLIALALPFLFDTSRRVRIDRWVGELSYPIYLIHLPVIVGINAAFPAVRGSGLVLLEMILTLALSVAFLVVVDTPFEAWRQRRGRLTLASNSSMQPLASQNTK